MPGFLETIQWGASKGKEKGSGFGLLTPATQLVGGIAGGIYGAIPGAAERQLEREQRAFSRSMQPSEQQAREFAMEQQLRGQSWRNVEKTVDAQARDKARIQALGMGDMDVTRLRDIGQGAEAARAGAAVEADIFKQETSATAKREARIAWVMQQIQSMMAAGTATQENIAALGPLSGGDPEVIAVIQTAAMNAPGKPTLGGDLGEIAVGYGLG